MTSLCLSVRPTLSVSTPLALEAFQVCVLSSSKVLKLIWPLEQSCGQQASPEIQKKYVLYEFHCGQHHGHACKPKPSAHVVLQSIRQLVHGHKLAAEALYSDNHTLGHLQAAGLHCCALHALPEGSFHSY